jgi:hypothetical protein
MNIAMSNIVWATYLGFLFGAASVYIRRNDAVAILLAFFLLVTAELCVIKILG